MDIPGIPAKHKIVTQNCRKRPLEEIRSETVDELWQEFERLNETWPKDADVKFRFVLLVER